MCTKWKQEGTNWRSEGCFNTQQPREWDTPPTGLQFYKHTKTAVICVKDCCCWQRMYPVLNIHFTALVTLCKRLTVNLN